MLKITKISLLFLLCIFLVNCRGSQAIEFPPVTSLNKNVVGVWSLKTVAGESPSKISIKSWQVTFSENGKWSYSGSMTGQYEGMQLKGSGTYVISENVFEYTAGDNSGKSKIELKGSSLIFSPDPVVKPNGTDDVVTTYERVN